MSTIKYVSTYDVNEATTARAHGTQKNSNILAELNNQDDSKNTQKAVSRDTCISKEDMETNRSASQHIEVMTKRNMDDGVDEEKKKSLA